MSVFLLRYAELILSTIIIPFYIVNIIKVLAKTCKIIPVMLMGKLMSGKKYQYYEYVTAVGIWIGMAIFQFFTENKHSGKYCDCFYFLFVISLFMSTLLNLLFFRHYNLCSRSYLACWILSNRQFHINVARENVHTIPGYFYANGFR